jgi:two-component system, sensor histidine kinase and response regulator
MNTPKILIVDDTPTNLQLLSEMFKGQGYEIRAALSGRLALQSIQNEPPDLIMLDITMPDISGYDVCSQVKADPALRDIPIIFVSGLQDNNNIVKAFSVGGVDYITKPFQVSEVLARVKTHLELRRQRQELQENNIQLKALEELRDNLVHMIIHDMRNPLWNTHGYLEMVQGIKDAVLPPLVVEYIGEALDSTRQLMVMINSILDVSKMEAGMIPLRLSEFDLAVMIQDIIDNAAILKKSRTLELEIAGPHTTVVGDPSLLARVIDNLLTNALTYTAETTGTIHFQIESDDHIIRVNIQDNGQGIPSEYHLKIFEKFFQVNSALSGQRHATGLGLTFCQLAVEAHGGRIGVQSEENQGSLFWFELPIKGPVPTEDTPGSFVLTS